MVSSEWILGINETDLKEVHAIRHAVFCQEQQIAESIEQDGLDTSGIHVLVSIDGTPAATGRLLVNAEDFTIGRVAVLPQFRGMRLGDFVMRLLIRTAFDMGGERQVVHSQLLVAEFYEKLGFVRVGEVYEEAGIAHITMERFGDIFGTCE